MQISKYPKQLFERGLAKVVQVRNCYYTRSAPARAPILTSKVEIIFDINVKQRHCDLPRSDQPQFKYLTSSESLRSLRQKNSKMFRLQRVVSGFEDVLYNCRMLQVAHSPFPTNFHHTQLLHCLVYSIDKLFN